MNPASCPLNTRRSRALTGAGSPYKSSRWTGGCQSVAIPDTLRRKREEVRLSACEQTPGGRLSRSVMTAPHLVFHFARRLCRRNPFLGELPEGAPFSISGPPGRISAGRPRAQPAKLLEQLALPGGQLAGHHDLGPDELVALAAAPESGEPVARQPEGLPARRLGRDLHRDPAPQRGHFHLGAQRRLPHGERQLDVDVVLAALEAGMRRHPDLQVEVAARAAAGAGRPLPRRPDPGAGADPGRDLHLHAVRAQHLAGAAAGRADGLALPARAPAGRTRPREFPPHGPPPSPGPPPL